MIQNTYIAHSKEERYLTEDLKSIKIDRCVKTNKIATLQTTADVQGRRRLRPASTSTLVVPPTHRATIGDRAFPAAASRVWNSLPTSVREIQSLPAFRWKLKTTLFDIFYRQIDRHLVVSSAPETLSVTVSLKSLHYLLVLLSQYDE